MQENGRVDWLRADLQEIKATLQRMDEKHDRALEKLESRVSSLERWRSSLIGAWTVLAAGVGLSTHFGGLKR